MIQCRGIWCAQSSPKLRYLVLRLINSFTIVASATAPDSRSDEGAMLIHCNRGATTKTGPFRCNPEGRWGLRAISSSRFVAINEHRLLIAPRRRLASPIGALHKKSRAVIDRPYS